MKKILYHLPTEQRMDEIVAEIEARMMDRPMTQESVAEFTEAVRDAYIAEVSVEAVQ